MKLTITRTVNINVDEIINTYNLKSTSTNEEINLAIFKYSLELEDADYYAIIDNEEAYNKIRKEIKETIFAQMPFFDGEE